LIPSPVEAPLLKNRYPLGPNRSSLQTLYLRTVSRDEKTNISDRVPTSLQFTSDSGIVPEGGTPEERRDSSLVEVMRDSPVVRFLSSGERQRDEDELRRLEEERAERERDTEEIADLDPLPSQVGPEGGNGSGEAARAASDEPLLR